MYPPPPGASPVLGLEVSGTVESVGSDVSRYKVGDKVMALIQGGGYAQYAVSHELCTLPIPKGISVAEAAGIPETFWTVWHNVFQRGGLKSGEKLLVHGGSSGIGTTAIQLAKAFGAKVYTTVGSEDKRKSCTDLGADVVVNYRTNEDWDSIIKADAGKGGIDLILDYVGGDYVSKNLDLLGLDGRLVQIGFLRGPKVTIDVSKIMMKRLQVTGSTMRARDNEFKGVIAKEIEAHVFPLFESGKVKPLLFKELPLENAAEAHEIMESNALIGKVVLLPHA